MLADRGEARKATASAISCGVGEPAGGQLHHLGRDRGQHTVAVGPHVCGEDVGRPALVGPPSRQDRAGTDAVDADAVRPELLGEGLRQVDQRRLRRPVVDVHARRLAAVHGRDVDDRAIAALDHQRDRGATGPHRGQQVELEHVAPVVVVEPEEAEARQAGSRRRAAGIVDEDVEAAERLDSPRDDLRWGVRIHEVGRGREAARRRVRRARGCGCARSPRRGHPRRAGSGRPPGRCPSRRPSRRRRDC